ncbi:MAG: hypothetical protein IPG50_37955 [Myxococcales bacterium]|nr:hypothetical protein [Myxococcales bacterium]
MRSALSRVFGALRTSASVVLLSAGCAPSDAAEPASAPAAASACASSCTVGARRCSERGDPEECRSEANCGAWHPVDACVGETACRDGECASLSPRQIEQKKDLATFVDKLAASTGSYLDLGVDAQDVLSASVTTLVAGADDDAAYYRAARRALVGFRNGHIDLFSNTKCGSAELPELFTSRVGACAQPFRDHAVVAYANEGNALGLRAGDRIVSVDGRAGAAMLDAAFHQAACGVGSSSESNRRFVSATSLFAAVRVGSTVEVARVDGTVETKTVERLEAPVLCRFPHPGSHAYPAKATRRSDGVAVVEVPTFLLPTSPRMTESDLAERIAEELDKAKDAKGIVWDLRGNPGGATFVGLSIVGGMPGFTKGVLAKCAARQFGSVPFAPVPGSTITFQVSAQSRFAYAGKVAVIVDGLTTSAGDYFALAVSSMTGGQVALVGSPTAGAFGGVGKPYDFGKLLPMRFTADESRCTDPTGAPLERRGVEPAHLVELQPEDLQAGRDTVVEAAAALVR